MDVNRFVLMTLLEVVKGLCGRFGIVDAEAKCDQCIHEVQANGALKKDQR